MKPLNQGLRHCATGTLYNELPSPFWGDEIVWDLSPAEWAGRKSTPKAVCGIRDGHHPATWCGKGSDNPYAKNFPSIRPGW